MRQYTWAVLPVGVVITSAAAAATVWIVGERSTTDYGGGLDYMVKPLPISSTVISVVGAASLAVRRDSCTSGALKNGSGPR